MLDMEADEQDASRQEWVDPSKDQPHEANDKFNRGDVHGLLPEQAREQIGTIARGVLLQGVTDKERDKEVRD